MAAAGLAAVAAAVLAAVADRIAAVADGLEVLAGCSFAADFGHLVEAQNHPH